MRGIPSKVSTVIVRRGLISAQHICRESEMKARFRELRWQVMDIYRTWHATPRVVSRTIS